jgi:hypothetical protein
MLLFVTFAWRACSLLPAQAGAVFSTRQVLSSMSLITLSDSVFQSCTTSLSAGGGAIYVSNTNSVFNLTSCQFYSCHSTNSDAKGGGVGLDSVKSAYFLRFSGTECSSQSSGGFCYVRITSWTVGTIEFNESSGTRGVSYLNTFSLGNSELPVSGRLKINHVVRL